MVSLAGYNQRKLILQPFHRFQSFAARGLAVASAGLFMVSQLGFVQDSLTNFSSSVFGTSRLFTDSLGILDGEWAGLGPVFWGGLGQARSLVRWNTPPRDGKFWSKLLGRDSRLGSLSASAPLTRQRYRLAVSPAHQDSSVKASRDRRRSLTRTVG